MNQPYQIGQIINLTDGRLASVVRIQHLTRHNIGLLFTWRISVVDGNSIITEIFA